MLHPTVACRWTIDRVLANEWLTKGIAATQDEFDVFFGPKDEKLPILIEQQKEEEKENEKKRVIKEQRKTAAREKKRIVRSV
jgi:hypothetical protein